MRSNPRVPRGDGLPGAEPRVAPLVRALSAVTSVLLLLTGCTGAGAAGTSGPLAGGFEIEAGSGLVGTVFPVTYPDGADGWQAVLRVDGDVTAAFRAYLRQARELGYPLEDRALTARACGDPDAEYTSHDPLGPFPVACNVNVFGPEERLFNLSGLVDRDGQGFIRISVGVTSDPPGFSPVSEGLVAWVTAVELAPGLNPETDRPPVHVVEGSALIADPLPFGLNPGGGYVAVLQVTSELAPVMRAYEAQFRNAGAVGGGEDLIENDGELIIETEMAGAGGLSAVGVTGDPSYVLISRVYD